MGIVIGAIVLSEFRDSRRRSMNQPFDAVKCGVRKSTPKYYAVEVAKVESFIFDPNEADSNELLRLGFAPFQVRSIYKYRAKGGRFTCPDDLRRVYRLTIEQWRHLRSLIRISEKYQLAATIDMKRRNMSGCCSADTNMDSTKVRHDSLSAVPLRKFASNEVVDINNADSITLCRIPGIGRYFASQIINYRKRLGGFTNIEQLLEIDNFPSHSLDWMEVSPSSVIQKININTLGVRGLMRHPYLGYYRANEIVSYRRVHGALGSVEALKSLPHFSEEDVERLKPYVCF